MKQNQYIKILQYREIKFVNLWIRKARESGRISGYLAGGRVVAKGVNTEINDIAVVVAYKKAHVSDVMAAAAANKISRMLHRLRYKKGV